MTLSALEDAGAILFSHDRRAFEVVARMPKGLRRTAALEGFVGVGDFVLLGDEVAYHRFEKSAEAARRLLLSLKDRLPEIVEKLKKVRLPPHRPLKKIRVVREESRRDD